MVTISVALDALRACAAQLTDNADALSETSWPAIAPTALRGAAVGNVDSSDCAARLSAVVTDLRAWADNARSVADAFERAEARARDGLAR